MNVRLLTLVCLGVSTPVFIGGRVNEQEQTTRWSLGGNKATAYAFSASGNVLDSAGATVSLKSTDNASGSYGSASSVLPVHETKLRRVRIVAQLRAQNVEAIANGGASLWLRVDRDSVTMLIDNGTADALTGSTEWVERSISLPLPADASRIAFGVLLRNNGTIEARKLRVEIGELAVATAPMETLAQSVLDSAINAAKHGALKRNEVKWDAVEPVVRTLASGAQKSADVYPAIRYLLSQLNDHHSFMMPPVATTQFRTGGATNPIPEVKTVADNIGYINVPAYGGAELKAMQSYTERVHASLSSTYTSLTCGWVVDLRTNSGGNMWPMLAGLKPLLGNDGLGSFVTANGAGPSWVAGQGIKIEPPVALNVMKSLPVAVLTGPRTASSGEAVAIAFRGRPDTRAFGLPTAGLSTANSTIPLPDGAMILLTTAIEADRTGARYGDKLPPDQVVIPAGQLTNAVLPSTSPTTASDTALSVAVNWLQQHRSCQSAR